MENNPTPITEIIACVMTVAAWFAGIITGFSLGKSEARNENKENNNEKAKK